MDEKRIARRPIVVEQGKRRWTFRGLKAAVARKIARRPKAGVTAAEFAGEHLASAICDMRESGVAIITLREESRWGGFYGRYVAPGLRIVEARQ